MDTSSSATTLRDVLIQYQNEYLPARNLASRTRLEYVNDITQAVEFLGPSSIPRNIDSQNLRAFMAELDTRGLRGSSRRRKMAAVRSFFGFLHEAGVISSSPTLRLAPPAREHPQPRVLTEQEYQNLQLVCSHETRDSAVIELILQTGMRLSEVAGLRIPDLEFPGKITKEGPPGAVHIRGKGRKQRTVTLNWKAAKAIRAYLAVRPPLPSDHVFVGKFGEPLGATGIQRLVKKYLALAGISGAHTHTLRHTFGTHSYRKGTKLDVIRKALGHESLDTTSIYIDLARGQMDKELQENAL